MPFIEDWITQPMTIIGRLHGKTERLLRSLTSHDVLHVDKSPSTFEQDVRNYFQSHIDNLEVYREIPSLNDRSLERPLPSGCLVRFRAMIQDMSDDEIYCSKCRSSLDLLCIVASCRASELQGSFERSGTHRNRKIGQIHGSLCLSSKNTESGVSACLSTVSFVVKPGFHVVDDEPAREKFGSRQCFSCVAIPNETHWVKEAYRLHYGEQMLMHKRFEEHGDLH